jgi:hypothetical protein
MNFSIITFMQPGDWFVFVAVFGAMQALTMVALLRILAVGRGAK